MKKYDETLCLPLIFTSHIINYIVRITTDGVMFFTKIRNFTIFSAQGGRYIPLPLSVHDYK